MNNSATITLEEDSAATVMHGDVKVAFNAKGSIAVYGAASVTLYPPANDSGNPIAKAEPQVGDKMTDGTIFAGISPDTGEHMFVTPGDAPGTMKWKAAMQYAATLDAHGHTDWRLPSKPELNELFNNRAAIGGFQNGWYWSSTEFNNYYARIQRFSVGNQNVNVKSNSLLVRCVRR